MSFNIQNFAVRILDIVSLRMEKSARLCNLSELRMFCLISKPLNFDNLQPKKTRVALIDIDSFPFFCTSGFFSRATLSTVSTRWDTQQVVYLTLQLDFVEKNWGGGGGRLEGQCEVSKVAEKSTLRFIKAVILIKKMKIQWSGTFKLVFLSN